MKRIIPALTLLFFSLVHLGMASENPFLGQWQPDLEATIANAKKDPKFKKEDTTKMETILPQLIGSMRMEITPTTLTMRFGKSREQSTPYTVQSVSDTETVLELQVSDSQTVGMVIQAQGEDRFSIRVEGNNDMNFYVWKSADSMDVDDPNMAAIVAAAMEGKPTESKEATPLPIAKAIQNNLRIISSAADQYSLENGVVSSPYSKLEGEYFKPITPVNGESYKELVIESSDKEISVTDQDGNTHTFKRR